MSLKTINMPEFQAAPRPPTMPYFGAATDDEIVGKALSIISRRMKKPLLTFSDPTDIQHYVRLKASLLPYEVFSVFFFSASFGLIAHEEMFRGTLTQTSVYPREIVMRAMELNCASVVFSHNHPSGVSKPSRADENLTQRLKAALALVDVRVVDHIIVGGETVTSMSALGLM